MADFTSTQTGNWDDGATWGNTSPGVAGTDFPGVSADTVTIAATHVVTYDSGDNEAVEYGDIVVSGTLTFPTNADSTLTMGTTNDITINSGGSFLAGSSTTPIGAAYQCKIIFRYTTEDRVCFDSKDGSTLEMYGDPDYYGDDFVADLDSDWTTGQTLYVTGDYTDWPVDGLFCIHKNTRLSDVSTDTQFYTIASLTYDSDNDRTAIVINETAPGLNFYQYYYDGTDSYTGWNGKVWMVDRNVKMTTDSLTNELDLTMNIYQTTSNDLKHFECVQFQGFEDRATMVYNLSFNKCTVIHTEVFFTSQYSLTFTNSMIAKATKYGFQNSTFVVQEGNWFVGVGVGTLQPAFYSCSGIGNAHIHIIGSYYGIYDDGNNPVLNVTIVSCHTGLYTIDGTKVKLSIFGATSRTINIIQESTVYLDAYDVYLVAAGLCGDTYVFGSVDNIYGIYGPFSNSGLIVFKGTLSDPIIGDSLAVRKGSVAAIESTIDGTYRDYCLHTDTGDTISITSADTNWEIPPSANTWILEFKPNTAQGSLYTARGIIGKWHKVPIAATDTTVTFKVYSKTWNNPRINTGSTGEYGRGLNFYIATPDGATGESMVIQQSAPQVLSNGAWTDIVFTVSPDRDGFLEWTYDVHDAENITLLIDPIVVIS